MSESKMREEFEAWVISNWPNQSLGRFNPLHGVTEGEYTGFTVQHCWEAWQASREALVIELLPHVTAEECAAHLEIDDDIALDVSYMINGAIIACGGMIKAAGLKVKQ